MITGEQLLAAFDTQPSVDALASTGITEVDEITGGLQAGHVWVVTGGVGEGKTTLLTQLAVSLAANGHATQLVCPRETAAWSTRRLLSRLGPTVVDLSNSERRAHDPRLSRAREALAELPLRLSAKDTTGFTPEVDPYAEPAATAVLVDDADLVGGMTPRRAQQYAGDGRFVGVTLPREQVLTGPGDRAPLAAGWGRVSDVVLEVRTRTIGGRGLPDAPDYRPTDLRPGEAELVVHRNRWGWGRMLHVEARLHYAQFRDLPASEG